MKIAVVSDLHGNLPAFDAVLAELEREGVDELVCLGDVAAGPQPAETVARVRGLGCRVVMGNWDAWFLDGFPTWHGDAGRFIEQGEWWSRQLSTDDRAFLRTFEARSEIRPGGLPALCFHGSPGAFDDVILATTPNDELLGLLAGYDQPLMLGGHTHVQLVRVVEGTLVVNPGSVGLPFRGRPWGEFQPISPWAEYALVSVDDGRLSVELRRTSYDVEAMLQLAIASGVPHAAWWAGTWVRNDFYGGAPSAPSGECEGAPAERSVRPYEATAVSRSRSVTWRAGS